jgi:hypothetical protein
MTQNTPNLALPYPELTDTAHVPRDVEALAMKLDALLGGGAGGGGESTLPLAAAPVLDVGMVGQIRAGRQLSGGDFTSLGLSAPIGLWNLSDLTNLGSDGRPLTNLGAVPFGVGINGVAASCAVFAGSTGQALYIADSGAADPYRIKTGSWGCWFRVAKLGVAFQSLLTKRLASTQVALNSGIISSGALAGGVTVDGASLVQAVGVSNAVDDRWHFCVFTFDATVVRLYVDAVLEAAATVPGAIFGSSAPFNIGAWGADGSTAAGHPNYGRIDEAFVTADVLTPDQIRLLYAAKLAHTLGTIPTGTRLKVHRRRKGAAFAVVDFAVQPVRLHNFTGGALTDQGSGGVALVNNGAAVPVAGADGTPDGAFNFIAASNQSLSSTDAGLSGGLTARSHGCWFKMAAPIAATVEGWGTLSTGDTRIVTSGDGSAYAYNGADSIVGPFVADGQWHLAVVVEDNTAGDGVKRKFYVDGRLVGGSTVMTAVTLAGANHFRVGADPAGTTLFTGQIDGAFVCAYAMTPAEILDLWAKGTQDAGGSPKNSGDHVERVDATSVLWIADTLESQHTVDLGVVA